MDMLKELRENDEAHYPANTAHHPRKPDGYGRNAGHADRKGLGYIARPTNVEPYPDIPQDFVPNMGVLGKDLEDAYDKGYYIGVINTADEMSRCLRLCFNCGRGGHYWADCTEPLKDSLKQAKERVNRCSSWKNPPLEKTLPFTGAQNLWLQISNWEGGAQKNGYYQDVP